MTDAGSDSDESAGRTQEWEVVSLSTLSMSGCAAGVCSCEACTPAIQEAGSGRLDGGVPHANFLSNHFGSVSNHTTSPMLDQFLGSENESRTGVEEHRNDAPMDLDGDPNSNIEKPAVGMDVEEPHQATSKNGKQEEGEDASEVNFLPEMDWIKPMPPNTNNLMREESYVGSNRVWYTISHVRKSPLQNQIIEKRQAHCLDRAGLVHLGQQLLALYPGFVLIWGRISQKARLGGKRAQWRPTVSVPMPFNKWEALFIAWSAAAILGGLTAFGLHHFASMITESIPTSGVVDDKKEDKWSGGRQEGRQVKWWTIRRK